MFQFETNSAALLLSGGALLLAAALHFALVRALRSQYWQAADQPDPASDSVSAFASDFAPAERRARAWLGHLLTQAAAPLGLIIWTVAIHFATTELLEGLSSSDTPRLVGGLEGIRSGVVFLALLWLLIRIGRVIDIRLTAFAKRTPTQADDVLLPLVGKGIRVVLPLLAFMLGTSTLSVSPETRALIRDATSLVMIASVAFLLLQTVDTIQDFLLSRYRVDVENNYRARAVHTQVLLLRRLAVAVIGILCFASMLMVFDSVRRFGTTILASAGVAGVVIGFAAQRSIATLLAGFQIALTQPIRIDDVVIVENEWGRIEEITLTYVVVRLWDLRRLVVPITYFIEKPFQNWTRSSAQILGSIFFYLDYTVPLEALRKEFTRIVGQSELWDKQVCGMQVSDTKERCIEIRGLVSASDASRAWDLRCEVREKVLVWLSRHHPGALPRARVEFDADSPMASAIAARSA